jgi:mxaA protein
VNIARALVLVAVAWLPRFAPCAETLAVQATVEQPRPFGYVVGDLLTQRVLLQRDGRDFEPAALPVARRVSVWLERRAPRIVTAADGRRWLCVEYQLINAPQALRVVTLPAWELKAGPGAPSLAVAEWHLSVAPLTPQGSFSQGDLGELRPDRAPPLVPTHGLQRRAVAWAGACLLVLAAWTAWLLWRNRRAAHLPFAQARRELARLDDHTPEAWRALHRAFDRTAGRAIHGGSLPVLLQRAPHLGAVRTDIEGFYAHSQAKFFGDEPSAAAPSPRALCERLRRLERQHER